MKNQFFAIFGITFGSLALLLALMHFWTGSFSPTASTPTIESSIHKKISSIKQSAIDVIKGKSRQTNSTNFAKPQSFDFDKIADIITVVLAGLAIIFGIIAYVKKEPLRAAGSSVVLGMSAIVMQIFSIYFTWFIIALIIMTLVLAFANGGI